MLRLLLWSFLLANRSYFVSFVRALCNLSYLSGRTLATLVPVQYHTGILLCTRTVHNHLPLVPSYNIAPSLAMK